MKLRLPLLLGAMLLVLGAIAAACDGDGRLTLEEYFQQVEAVDAQFAERFEDIDVNLEFAPSFDASLAVDAFSARAGIWRAFAKALDGIVPPAQVKERHDEWMEAAANYTGAIDGLAEQLAGAKSFAEFTEVLEHTDANDAEDRGDDACLAVKAVGDDNDIEVDLQCLPAGVTHVGVRSGPPVDSRLAQQHNRYATQRAVGK